MTTAFVLSGGGSLGAVQAGMLRALSERGVAPELLVGTSVGAVNAAWMATRTGHEGEQQLGEMWCQVDWSPMGGRDWRSRIRAVSLRSAHLIRSRRLAALFEDIFGGRDVSDSLIPLGIVSTVLETGREEMWRKGSLVQALLASTAIPGLFAPVVVDGESHVDGGVTNNVPLAQAVKAGATTVYVMSAGYPCTRVPSTNATRGVVMNSLSILMQHRLALELEHYRGLVDLRVVPNLCPLSVAPTDFTHARELVDRAFDQTLKWLDNPQGWRQAESPTKGMHLHGGV